VLPALNTAALSFVLLPERATPMPVSTALLHCTEELQDVLTQREPFAPDRPVFEEAAQVIGRLLPRWASGLPR
jgi:hypothetical protein